MSTSTRYRGFSHLKTVFAALFVALSLFCAVPSQAQTKLVFAHFMVAHRDYGSSVEGYKRAIREAQAYGVDGFALNVGEWDFANYKNDTALIFQAALELNNGFKLFFSIDGAGSSISSAEAIDMVTTYANHPNHFKYNSRPFVSTFGGEGANGGGLGARDWWRNQVLNPLIAQGYNVYFVPFFYTGDYAPVPTYTNLLNNYNAWWKDVADGGFDFGAGALPSYAEPSLLRSAEARAKVFHDAGRTFMSSVTPQYWGDKQTSNGRVYHEFQGGEGLAAQWNSVIVNQKPEWVELVTWNDFGEATYFSPIDDVNKYWPYADSAHTQLGFYKSHVGFAALNKYYIQWYKSGTKPAITRDRVFYAYRTHPKDAVASNDPRGAVTNRNGNVQDNIYVTTMTSSSAVLKVITGGVTKTYNVGSGIVHTQVPFNTGTQVFELWRNNVLLMSQRGDDIIANPVQLNFGYSSGVIAKNLTTNPGFEAGTSGTQTPTGWSESAPLAADVDASYTEGGSHGTGVRHCTHWKGSPYQVSTFQTKTGLANGTYSLRAWIMGPGGQSASGGFATLYAKNYGGNRLNVDAPASGGWTMITIPAIQVTNGQCEIGFESKAGANQWLYFDDVEFYRVD